MIVEILPSTASGMIRIPASKSIAHRVMIASALAQGISFLENIHPSNDILATMQFVMGIGSEIIWNDSSMQIQSSKQMKPYLKSYHFGDSASTLRFTLPIFALFDQEIEITASKKLLTRPLSVYETLFKEKGVMFEKTNESIRLKGKLPPGNYKIAGDVSSQFISGLFFALPLVVGDSTLEIIGNIESKPYIDLTISVLATFGIRIIQKNDRTYFIPGNQQYQPQNIMIEGDYSQLAFFAALGAIHAPINIIGVNEDSIQGDKQILNIVASMGATVCKIPEGYRVEPGNLKGITMDISNTPDLGPILVVLGLMATGKTILKNVNRLRLKESNRVEDLKDALARCDLYMESTESEIIVYGAQSISRKSQTNSMNDHRICMALAVLATTSKEGVVIEQAECIEKSYPAFFDDLISLGIKVIRN